MRRRLLRGPVLLGAAACVACCAAPIAALLVGAGAASTIAAIFEPQAGVLLAAAVVLGIAIYVRHRRAARAAAGCDCGPKRSLYTSPEPAAEAPVVCTVDLTNGAALRRGLDDYRHAFTHLVGTERTAEGFRWRFRPADGLEPRLQRLARAEHACCSFLKFDLTSTADEIVWETRAASTDAAQRALEEYMALPARLREEPRLGHDVAHLKAAATRAGLSFSSDAR